MNKISHSLIILKKNIGGKKMNLFSKNPFAKTNENTRIVGNKFQFDEKKKIEKLKENMVKLQYQKEEYEEPNVNEKINNLKDIEKWK